MSRAQNVYGFVAAFSTPEWAARCEAMRVRFEAGDPAASIAQEFGVAVRSVYEMGARRGWKRSPIKRSRHTYPGRPNTGKTQRAREAKRGRVSGRLARAGALRAAFESGERVDEIAARFGINPGSVRARAYRGKWRRSVVSKPRPSPSPTWHGLVRPMFEAGAPYAEMRRKSGRGGSTIRSAATALTWNADARRAAIKNKRAEKSGICRECRERKQPDDFYLRKTRKAGVWRRDTLCIECARHRARQRDDRLSGSLTIAEINELFAAAKRCTYCDRPLKSREKTLDHVQPISRGGQHERSNAVIACSFCNTSKGARTLDEWTPPNRRAS